MNRRIGGTLFLKVDGELFQAKGEFTYNINPVKREMIAGADTIHGFKEEPKVPFIEGAITDSDELDLEGFQAIRDATITLELANGKVIVLREACYAADGDVTHTEGEIQVRFEGITGREVR
jgi:hypothetical protein